MPTQQTASIMIANATDGDASIVLFHSNSSNGVQSGTWQAKAGESVGPLTVHFETGFGSEFVEDYWSVLLHVKNGSAPGFFVSSGSEFNPFWQECQLEQADAEQTIPLSVSQSEFNLALDSGGCTGAMRQVAPAAPITHFFVVMLENHSFDNMFAMSGIPGIDAATTADRNFYNGATYPVQGSAPLSMPTDPGHEFLDVLEQLAGPNATYRPNGTYPAINNSGFAASYATSTTEGPAPPPEDIGDVMACFNTSSQLPVMYQAATEFALCDHWYSSLPGPTWPNRFFLHGASSSGLDDSPTNERILEWELPGDGFQYPNGSIYQSLSQANVPYRFYHDSKDFLGLSNYSDDPQNGSIIGAIPQVSSLSGVSLCDFNSLEDFAADLQGPYPYPYTFIEPHYGDITHGSYAGGSSQHPMDDVYGGEHLLAAVYSAIRNSPYWDSSCLIIVYDEHGGLYDHAAPPPAVAPGDNPNFGYSKHGFNFEQYGVRTPAIVVSPLIPKGTVDHTVYDHTSVLKTVEDMFGLPCLTQRDALANSFSHLFSLPTPRDCPTSLVSARPPLHSARRRLNGAERQVIGARPVPPSGNLAGALAIVKKTELEMSDGSPEEIAAINARYAAIQTRAEAEAYAASVFSKVSASRQARRLAARRRA